MEHFRYLARVLAIQNSIHEEIKSRLKPRYACCNLLQNLFVFQFTTQNVKIKVHRTIILPFALYWCETCSLTSRGEHRTRVLENGVFRIFGPNRDEVIGEWRRLQNEERYDLYSTYVIWLVMKSRRVRWLCMQHGWER